MLSSFQRILEKYDVFVFNLTTYHSSSISLGLFHLSLKIPAKFSIFFRHKNAKFSKFLPAQNAKISNSSFHPVPELKGDIRDYATINELICLSRGSKLYTRIFLTLCLFFHTSCNSR